MIFLKRFYLFLFCFVFILSISAQDNNKTIALKTILKSIENQHHVSFNYIDNEIKVYWILPPKNKFSLSQKLDYLQENTNLLFENINNQYINVSDKKPIEKKNFCGYIFSKDENLPLENVNLKLENGQNITTNKDGYFEFEKANNTEIVISCVGFIPKKIMTSSFINTNCSRIFLDTAILTLDNINTNQYLTSGISKSINGTFVMKPKISGILPGLIEPDVLQTMQQIPGINSADESVASINVRGGTHDQNLFLWNGIRMFQTGHFFGLISAFNPNLAHEISISKNGSSAFYGESVSSVIDMVSNPNKIEKNSFSAGINMINADLYSKINLNRKGFLEIAARKSITDFIKSPTYKQYYNKAFQNASINNLYDSQNLSYTSDEKFDFYDFTLKYSQEIGKKNHLNLDLITINDKLNVAQSEEIGTQHLSENNTLYQKNYGGNISINRNWNSNNSSNLNFYSSYYELDADKNRIESNQNIRQENIVFDNGVKLENHHVLNKKITLSNGYQINQIGVSNIDDVNSPQFYKKLKDVLLIHALVLEGKFTDSISRIYLNIGLRTNYITQFKKYLFEPRLQFNYGITKDLNLEILGEIKSQNSFQVIDLQNDYFGIEKRRWILANDSTIPIQKSKQISVNFNFSKNNWLLNIENFYKKITGINSSEQGFQNQLEFVKINGDYEVFGTEILLQKKINHFLTWISYTYNDNNYNFGGLEQPLFSNNFELDHVVSWAGIYQKDNFKIALGSKWYSGRPKTTPSSPSINYSNPTNPKIDYNSPNSERLNDFLQVNFSATYKWKSSNNVLYRMGISVLNIFNRQNEINEFYRINSVTNTIDDVKTFSIKRTPNISFRVSF